MKPDRLPAFAALLTQERRTYPTRTAFAKAAGITRTTLRALESGTQNPDDATIEKLAAVLHMTPEALKGEEPIKSDHPLLKELETQDLEHANRFRRAPAAAKHAAKDFLGPKISDAHRERIAEILLVLLRDDRAQVVGLIEDFLTNILDTTKTQAAPATPTLVPTSRHRRK